MDGSTQRHGQNDGNRRGGGRGGSGSLSRKPSSGSSTVYRRVQAVPAAEDNKAGATGVGIKAATTEKPDAQGSSGLQRQLSGSEPRKFTSSLQKSLHANKETTAKSESGGGNGGRGRSVQQAHAPVQQQKRTESVSSRDGGRQQRDRSRSPRSASRDRMGSRSKNGDAHAGSSRRVAMSPSPSPRRRLKRTDSTGSVSSTTSSTRGSGPRKGREPRRDEPPRSFSSSLARSVASNNSQTLRYNDSDRGRNHRGGSVPRAAGREWQPPSQREDAGKPYRHVEISNATGSDRPSAGIVKQPFRSSLGRSIPRKNSTDSISSLQSEPGPRSRWGAQRQSGASDGYHSRGRQSFTDEQDMDRGDNRSRGDRSGDRLSLSRLERSVSDSTSTHLPPPPLTFSKNGQNAPPASLSFKPVTQSSQDVRSLSASSSSRGGGSQWKSSITASSRLGGDEKPNLPAPRSSATLAAGSAKTYNNEPAVPFKSSLTASIKDSEASSSTEPVVSEEERKRLANEKLKERFEARKMERGLSLSSMIAKDKSVETPLLKPNGAQVVAGGGDSATRSSPMPFRSGVLKTNGATLATEKDARTRDFFAKLDGEDRQREDLRRAAPFQSSLKSSLKPARSSAVVKDSNKITYTLAELRRLKGSAIPRPADLASMTLGEEIQVRVVGRSVSGAPSARRAEPQSRKPVTRRGGRQEQRSRTAAPPRQDRRSNRRGGYQPPPPPLYDGPIEPLQVSENRWVGKKEKTGLDGALSHVKSLLNKLTREKFAKITDELCKTKMESMTLLRLFVAAVMDKALAEPSFADVYADFCKEFHSRTASTVWSFLRAVENTNSPGKFCWTAVRNDDTSNFVGPFSSVKECLDNAASPTQSDSSKACDITLAKFYMTEASLIAIVEESKDSFYYRQKPIAELSEDEPVLGEFDSAASAIQGGAKQTTFKRLLVTRCQFEFEKSNERAPIKDTEQDTAIDKRQRDIIAMRSKRIVLGNIRFIGELYKADMLNQSVVEGCIFRLLGLELVAGASGNEIAGQEVRFPDEEDVEALCKLLGTVGKKYDQPKRQTHMRIIILRLVELSDDAKLPSRARFMLKDVLEMRDHLWEPRRKELQQKTLDEVRREAKKLQMQGKNAQHDDLKKRRLKSQVSSVQLAKQSASLLVRKDSFLEESSASTTAGNETDGPASSDPVDTMDAAKMDTRIKSIIQEYVSIHDIEEAAVCVRELPNQYLVDFSEQIVNRALEGKEKERVEVVNLLVSLYEGGAVDATSIQVALVRAMEFLEDIKIDIPLAHQYSALVFGRLIAAGCFGLSWLLSDPLAHLVDCGLASLVFAEVLHVVEMDSDEISVVRMIADEEIRPASVLPPGIRENESEVTRYVEDHELEVYFGRGEDDEDEVDPEVEAKVRSTLDEYFSVKDVDEVVLCVHELESLTPHNWRDFVRVGVMNTIDAKQGIRVELAALMEQLFTRGEIELEDLEAALASSMLEYEDLRVDIPTIGRNFAELWTALFYINNGLTVEWLYDASTHLVARGFAAEVLCSLCQQVDTTYGNDELVAWWRRQTEPAKWWALFSGMAGGDVHESLVPWQEKLGA